MIWSISRITMPGSQPTFWISYAALLLLRLLLICLWLWWFWRLWLAWNPLRLGDGVWLWSFESLLSTRYIHMPLVDWPARIGWLWFMLYFASSSSDFTSCCSAYGPVLNSTRGRFFRCT